MQIPHITSFGKAVALCVLCLPITLIGQSTPASPGTSGAQDAASPSSNSQHSSTLSSTDKKFIKEAAQGGMAEVELGTLASEKGSSEDVKKFGKRMVDDHSKANDELKQIATSKGVDVPQSISAKDKMLKERLSKLSGAEFDRTYMESMVKDHKKDVADFTKESGNGGDPDVKQFASKTLPTLKEHLQAAEGLAPTAKNASAQSPSR
jgi:putative membrane protein